MHEKDEMEEAAVNSLHNPFSCAQAVYAAFTKNPSKEVLAFLKENSGGHNGDGLCGSLFAAHFLTHPSKHAQVNEFFIKNAGGLTCKNIKKGADVACSQCVIYGVRAVIEAGPLL